MQTVWSFSVDFSLLEVFVPPRPHLAYGPATVDDGVRLPVAERKRFSDRMQEAVQTEKLVAGVPTPMSARTAANTRAHIEQLFK